MKTESSGIFSRFICRPLRGLGRELGSVPQARLRHRLGPSFRQLRRLVEGFPITYRSVRVETLSENKDCELTT